MALKTYNPVTPSQRQLVTVDRSALHKGAPEKSLTDNLSRKAGRNNQGRISVRRRGGGHAHKYRIVDFKRQKQGMEATVERLEYDPNRTAFIALIEYTDGEKAYIIAPQKLQPGDKISAGPDADIKPGNALPLKNIPVGTVVHNVEMKAGKGAQMARSAGASVQIIGRDGALTQLRLASGEQRSVHESCMATVGVVSNSDHANTNTGKAGRNRWKGRRPKVRGVVMNPVDHPMGGGEGRTSGGRHPVTPWGKITRGRKTRAPKKPSNKLIIRTRHQTKRRK